MPCSCLLVSGHTAMTNCAPLILTAELWSSLLVLIILIIMLVPFVGQVITEQNQSAKNLTLFSISDSVLATCQSLTHVCFLQSDYRLQIKSLHGSTLDLRISQTLHSRHSIKGCTVQSLKHCAFTVLAQNCWAIVLWPSGSTQSGAIEKPASKNGLLYNVL